MKLRRILLFSTILWSLSGLAFAATPISGLSPYPDGGDPTDPAAVSACNGSPQSGRVYRNSETEPYLAVNPTNPDNLIAGWHQDRWSNGGGYAVGYDTEEGKGYYWYGHH